MILKHAEYGQVEVCEEGGRLKVSWSLLQPVELGFNTYSFSDSQRQRTEMLPAGEGNDTFALRMPEKVTDGSSVMLNVAIRSADGVERLDRQEVEIRRAAEAVRREEKQEVFWDRAERLGDDPRRDW